MGAGGRRPGTVGLAGGEHPGDSDLRSEAWEPRRWQLREGRGGVFGRAEARDLKLAA